MMMNAVEIIAGKRDGHALRPDEIAWMVDGYVRNLIPDYQISAWLMAVVLRGMDAAETLALTKAMIASGRSVNLSCIPGVKVDKHSTGGVGDKVSLILAPLAACAGVPVPMMAGRGLGHTGGTLDKLESIPGFQTCLSENAFVRQVSEIGCAVAGQTDDIVPADKKLYALRDVTGTVSSIPLICASIISKKKAEGADALVMDVKFGKGAFLPSKEKTVELAESLVKLGNGMGIKTEAVLTSMDQPLGFAAGNWLEVLESIEALQGRGPADLMEVTLTLGGMMLRMAGKTATNREGVEMLRPLLSSGRAYEKFLVLVQRQGGDVRFIEKPESYPRRAPMLPVASPVTGYVAGLDAMEAGLVSVLSGAGRMKRDDAVDPSAGIVFRKKTGDSVQTGETIAELYTNRSEKEMLAERLLRAYRFSEELCPKPKLIDRTIQDRA
jgi:pyrimidine-nucleoside phosphorylase